MRILIIEDETAAAVNLRSMLQKVRPEADIKAILEGVEESVAWFRENPDKVDLIFMDIHLADGEAFRIFEQVEVLTPVIFVTAYDAYALEAFKVNSIDYILKPVSEEELIRAFNKLEQLTGIDRQQYAERVTGMVETGQVYREAFLSRVRDRLVIIRPEEAAFFYTLDEQVRVTTFEGKSHPIDGTLESIMGGLSSASFFRANRRYIISRRAIEDISVWFGSRLSVNLKVAVPERIIISKARAGEFKSWLTAGG